MVNNQASKETRRSDRNSKVCWTMSRLLTLHEVFKVPEMSQNWTSPPPNSWLGVACRGVLRCRACRRRGAPLSPAVSGSSEHSIYIGIYLITPISNIPNSLLLSSCLLVSAGPSRTGSNIITAPRQMIPLRCCCNS